MVATTVKVETLSAEIAALDAQRKALMESQQYKREREFQTKLKALMAEYKMAPKQVIEIFDQSPAKVAGKTKQPRKEREPMTFANPHTGESVTTKGGNQKTLLKWRNEFGADTVASWRR